MIRRFLFCCGLLLAFCTPLFAQTPILSTNISAATAPNYGCNSWSYEGDTTVYNIARIAAGSPSGNDSLRITAIAYNGTAEVNWGCSFTTSLPNAPAQGSVRYVRWRVKYTAPINWRSDTCAVPPCDPNSRTVLDKLFIIGNNCESAPHQPTRVIYWQYAAPPQRNSPLNILTQNIGQEGPASGGSTGFFGVTPDTWLHVQIKITSSSTTSAYDGGFDVWINNNVVGSPTVVHPKDTLIKTSGWGRDQCANSNMQWGGPVYDAMTDDDPTANTVQEIADFVYDDEFDAAWALSQGGGGGAPMKFSLPGRKLRLAGLWLALPALGISWGWFRRERAT